MDSNATEKEVVPACFFILLLKRMGIGGKPWFSLKYSTSGVIMLQNC